MVMIFSWELCYQGSMSPVAGWEQTCPDMKTITHTHVHTFSLTPPVCLWAEVFAYVSLEALHWCVRGSLWQILKYSQLTPSSSPPSPPAWLLLFVQLSTCTRRPATPHKPVYMHLFFITVWPHQELLHSSYLPLKFADELSSIPGIKARTDAPGQLSLTANNKSEMISVLR